MILQAKTFDELSKEELFAILRARQDVFVVEQECAYHDIDDIDLSCVHVFAMEGQVPIRYHLKIGRAHV